MTVEPRATAGRGEGVATSRWGRFVLLLVVLAGAGWFLPGEAGTDLALVVLVAAHASAGVLIIGRSRGFESRERTAWTLAGIGFLLVAGGIVVVAVLELLGLGAQAFGPFDILFMAAYVVILGGFGWLPHLSGGWARRTRLLLDGVIGGVSIGAVLWITVVHDMLTIASRAAVWERVVGSAYPVFDLAALVVVMIVVVRRSAYRFDPRMLALATGISIQAVADIAYVRAGLGNSFAAAKPIMPLYLAAAGCFVLTGMLLGRRPLPREYAERRPSWVWMLAPYSATAVMVGVLVARVLATDLESDTLWLMLATGVVVVLVVARQAVAIRENRELVERQRAALVSSISHELRTPLTAMHGFISMMDGDHDLDEAELPEMISVVHQQTSYLSRIVSDLVMLARGDVDRMKLEPIPVDIVDLVLSAVASVEGGHDRVALDLPETLEARVDPDRLRQVLVNLLSNAIRYGGPTRLVVARGSGPDLLVQVHDDGPGVPKKYEVLIWDRFERGPNRLNASVPGSGIGLAVVEAIARAHGGAATYRRSERLGGSCFEVSLPNVVIPETGSIREADDLSMVADSGSPR